MRDRVITKLFYHFNIIISFRLVIALFIFCYLFPYYDETIDFNEIYKLLFTQV